MIRSFIPAAILAALTLLPASAKADSWDDPDPRPIDEDCGRCKKHQPPPPVTPVAPLPDEKPPEVVTPPATVTPPPPEFAPLPPLETPPSISDGYVRIGISGAVLGYFAPMTAEVLDEYTHPMLSGADGLVSAYGGITLGKKGYLEIDASYGRGTINSQYLGAGVLIGGQLNEDLILGGKVMGGVRDSDLSGLAYTSRRVGALVGPEFLWELDQNNNAVDVRVAVALLAGYSTNHQAITQQLLVGPEVGGLAELQFGGQTH